MGINRFTFTQMLCRRLPPVIAQQVRLRLYPFEQAQRDNLSFTARAQTGASFSGCTQDRVAWTFALHGYFNWRNVVIARTLCSPGDSIIEVGGNLGTETLSFADITGPQGNVFTFEPLPGNIDWLQKNIAANDYSSGKTAARIHLYPLAVGARCETAQFAVPPKENSGTGKLAAGSNVSNPAEADLIEVRCVTLDSLVDEIPNAKAIFMDIEGAEIYALQGGREYLHRYRPYVIIEALSFHIQGYGFTLHDLYAELVARNYAVFNISRFGLALIQPASKTLPEGDWCCIPVERQAAAAGLRRVLRKAAILPVIPGIHPLTLPA